MPSKKQTYVIVGALVAASVLLTLQMLMKKDNSDSNPERGSLRVAVNQPTSAFIESNSELPAFKSPIHPVSDGQFIFHNVSELVVAAQGENAPLVFPSLAPYGSVVVTLDTYDPQRRGANDERIKTVAFRPGSSANSPALTLEIAQNFRRVIESRLDCEPVGDSFSPGEIMTVERLSSALAQSDLEFLYRDAYRCGKLMIVFQISQPFSQSQAPSDERGFDVLLFIKSE